MHLLSLLHLSPVPLNICFCIIFYSAASLVPPSSHQGFLARLVRRHSNIYVVPVSAMAERNAVLLVNNLPEDVTITPDMLFTLFGVFGDVLRIKIMVKFKVFSCAIYEIIDCSYESL